MMGGEVPYKGSNAQEIKKVQMSVDVSLMTKEIPAGWVWQAADFINKCL